MNEQEIDHFCVVTGATRQEAESYLQIADGDVETAVTLYLENGETSHQPQVSERSLRTSHYDADEELARQFEAEEKIKEPVRAPIAPRHDILSGTSSIFDENAIWGLRESMHNTNRSVFNQGDSSSSTNPTPDFFTAFPTSDQTTAGHHAVDSAATAKAKRLADLFRPPFDIMFRGGFEEARDNARESNKWLLINVQDPAEFSCQILNRDLWSDITVKDIIKESFIFLQYGRDSPEGKRYLTLYPTQHYPHVAIIDARTGERIKVWDKQLSASDFMMNATEFLERQSSDRSRPAAMKRPRVTKDVLDMSEEEQINAAIAASLKAYGNAPEREDSVDIDEHDVSGGAVDDAVEPHGETEDFEDIEEEEPAVTGSLLDSIKANKRPEPTNLADSTRIQFRLVDGKRVIRRFMKTDPVRYLFEFVKAEVPQTEQQGFELVFNRKQLIDMLEQTIQEAGLENSAVNFVLA
ncbi:putative UBX domain protein [Phycomyces blakesleeanus]|uniref:UBX domain-containing protein n=1 Tax=Phycomyces blakesleeanus (strain ATCC 8743b / DSM 1359 / FGSC 10004 / NBRC 33097 / NRRL 1555) TaxID=763407 RepID=A0A162N6L2_PHYB8|nr:hypothetical protein PHYBLDRAFT_187623 [Phycomyces blakesleeanus NRRL 1555(-)]OAD71648.1 hypothetical protein PHYBLDRAFT_187623 [Phycomyces blakesleeanus NRRL 1555(-)]|eukprot:XP_018289688.1 hypothetical protein PHYBLDRAFT_187623 [Phycomyces blakesleeanus NRRL 1555(-)]